MSSSIPVARPHRARQAGVKYAKKKKKDLARKQVKQSHKNPRAFSFKSSQRAARAQRRNLDVGVKRQHLPIPQHTQYTVTATAVAPQDPPPFLVVVVGPPKTGKSSIICSLVKHYTGHNVSLQSIKGPVTILTSSTRRITLIECPPSLHSMVDLAKAADLVLLTVDASFGFEMETFEFLNLLKQHGFPRVMGVLTHLDHFRTTKQLNTVKKKMKHRFWTEICDGAKLFYLSGMIHGKYLKREVMNLARFVSVIKFRPIQWRNEHPYILADRMEDLTDPNEVQQHPLCDRRIALYGYVRGTLMHPNALFHFLGVGDYTPKSFTVLEDPVPIKHKKTAAAAESTTKVRKKLNEKQKRLYAPMSDVGDVIYDEDVVYIQMKDKHVHYSKEEMLVKDDDAITTTTSTDTSIRRKGETGAERALRQQQEMTDSLSGESVRMVRQLQDVSITVDEKMKRSGLQLFKFSTPITADDLQKYTERELLEGEHEEGQEDEDEDEDAEEDEEMSRLREQEASSAQQHKPDHISSRAVIDVSGRIRRKVLFDGEEDTVDQIETPNGDNTDEGEEEEEIEEEDDGEAEEEHVDEEEAEESEQEHEQLYQSALISNKRAGIHPSRAISTVSTASESDLSPPTDTRSNGFVLQKQSVKQKPEDEDEEELEDDEEDEEEEEQEEDEDIDELDEPEYEDEDDSSFDQGSSQPTPLCLHSASTVTEHPQLSGTSHLSVESSNLKWKDSLIDGAAARFQKSLNLMQLVYGKNPSASNNQQHLQKQQQQQPHTQKLQLLDNNQSDDDEVQDQRTVQNGHKAEDQDEDDNFFTRVVRDVTADDVDSVKVHLLQDRELPSEHKDWMNESVYETIRNRFVTGDWSEEAFPVTGEDDLEQEERDSDLEEAEKKAHRKARKNRRGNQQKDAHKNNVTGVNDDMIDHEEESLDSGITVSGTADVSTGESEEAAAEHRRKAKEALKQAFNAAYDTTGNKGTTTDGTAPKKGEEDEAADDAHYQQLHAAHADQSALNATAFADLDATTRLRLEGARPGCYVRIELIGIPCEFIQHYSPYHPLILGGLLHHEANVGYLSLRIKRHRWHRKILKSHDPLIFSIGWRRFQSCPVYAIEDANHRWRYLKYTPEHMHCMAITYAPFVPQNSGVIAYQYTDNYAAFRIAATGVVIDMSAAPSSSASSSSAAATSTSTTTTTTTTIAAAGHAQHQIVKKLKLIGHPYKIFKHTAYIRDMFTSSLEVNKFLGAKIQTVSGIRGAIKKAITTEGHDGVFRATFEDKILASDIVVCKSWSTVPVLPYCVPVTLLLFPGQKWQGMRTIRQIREQTNTPIPYKATSAYNRAVVRPMKKFTPLRIPAKLQAELPFALKPKHQKKRASNAGLYEQQRLVVRDAHETAMYRMMQQINTIKNVKEEKRRAQRERQRAEYLKKKAAEEQKHSVQNKEVRKRKYVAEGQGRHVKHRRYTDK